MSAPVIVTGAPVSGGSIVVEALVRAGLTLGEPAGGTDGLVNLHGRISAATRGLSAEKSTDVAALQADAAALVAARSAGTQAWGWHDVRTALCLGFWNQIVPDARWLFTVRHPTAHVWSLVTRGSVDAYAPTPVGRVRAALRLWEHFNRMLLQFAVTHRQRCLVISVPADMDASGESEVNRVVREEWQVALQPIRLEDEYIPQLCRQRAPWWVRMLTVTDRKAGALFRELRSAGVSPPATRTHVRAAPKSGPVVGIAASKRPNYSETFIRAHMQQLPCRTQPFYLRVPWRTSDELPLLNVFERVTRSVAGELGISAEGWGSRALVRHLKRLRVQAVLAEYGVNGVHVYRSCQRAGIPLIVHFHGYDAYKGKSLEEHRREYAEMFAAAAAIVAVSHEMEEQLLAMGAPRDKLVYSPYGVDMAHFSGADPGTAPPTFLAVGRFVEKKAPHLTLQAFAKVVLTVPDARLIMVGDGQLREPCMQLARAWRLGDKVSFLGAVSHAYVASLMRRVRAFVQHSVRAADGDSEGTPVAVLEAGAAGLPVVATTHAGIRDVVVHGETGFLVPEGDVDGMAHFMSMLAADARLAATLGRQARSHLSTHFSMDASIARLWSLIEGAIAPVPAVPRQGHVVPTVIDERGQLV